MTSPFDNKKKTSQTNSEIEELKKQSKEVAKKMEKEGFSLELYEQFNNLEYKIWFKEKQLKPSKIHKINRI